MKESIKQIFPLILTALCALFGISILYQVFDIGTAFSNIRQKNNTTTISDKLEAQEKDPFPSLLYIGKTLTTGSAYVLSDLFLIKTDLDTQSIPVSSPNIALYLIDVTSENGKSLLTTLSSSDIENLEELPSSVIYDSDKHLLYFLKNGIYTLHVRLYYNNRPGVLFECQIPVEMR